MKGVAHRRARAERRALTSAPRPLVRSCRCRGWSGWGVGFALAITVAGAGAEGEMTAGCPVPDGSPTEDWPGQNQWQELEEAGFVLGEIEVEVRDIYGASAPWYGRVANELHVNTNPAAIRSLLLIEPGSSVDVDRIGEAERHLRAQPFLTAARIVPLRCADGRVDTVVRVRDAWTLQVDASFSRAGGDSGSAFGIRDENVLGTGKEVAFAWDRDRERTNRALRYADPALLGSRWRLELGHRRASDGGGNTLALDRPFLRSDQAWGVRIDAENDRGDIDFDEAGDTAFTSRFDRERASAEWLHLLAHDGAGGWRGGVGWRRDHAEFGELEAEDPDLRAQPELAERRLDGPYLVAERFNDRFRTLRNVRRIGRAEDIDVGLDARLLAGRFRDGVAGTDPWFVEMGLDFGQVASRDDVIRAEANLSGRRPAGVGEWQAQTLGLAADHYHRTSRRNTVVTHAEFGWRENPDPEDELYLGGFDGLFAYPDRFRAGDRRWRVHVENRYTSDVVLFDTLQLGYTGFVEMGGVHGFDGRWGKTLADIGGGLRLGSLRSSFGTVNYVAIAFPLAARGEVDDFELVIGSTVDF